VRTRAYKVAQAPSTLVLSPSTPLILSLSKDECSLRMYLLKRGLRAGFRTANAALKRWATLGLCFGAVALGSSLPAAQAPQPDMTVRASVDRPAVFVGDRITYTIELFCKRGVDILADDLSRDKLRLDALDVIDARTDRKTVERDQSTIYRFDYVLTTYRIDVPTLKIAPLRVRYAVRRAGQRLEDASPAGEVEVPGATIAFRSLLPDEAEPSAIRSDTPPDVRRPMFAALGPIGLALIIVSVVPVLVAGATVARRARRPRVRQSARSVRHAERLSLETVRAMDVETVEGRRAALTQLDGLVREHLHHMCGVPGANLTPAEVPAALANGRHTISADLIASVLTTCELARYAPAHAMPSPDTCRDAIENTARIVGG
jgi:hypothetical protein